MTASIGLHVFDVIKALQYISTRSFLLIINCQGKMTRETQRLTANLHHRFNDQLIDSLQKQNISTISDFLRTDSNKLKHLLGIEDLADVVSMKTEFWKLIRISPINGFQHYELLMKHPKLRTGITSLDDLLNGGLYVGNLLDLCGLSAAGKTQLHTTIALNWAINYDYETFVIDTKGDFSGDRIHDILLHRKYEPMQCKQIMRKIRVAKCNSSLMELNTLITNLLQSVNECPNLKLLVIDSLPVLWFLHHGSASTVRHQKLAVLANKLRRLAVEHGIAVMTVNIDTRSIASNELIPSLQCDIDDNDTDEMNGRETDVSGNNLLMPITREIHTPALGKYWKAISSIRLRLQRTNSPLTSAATATTSHAVAAAIAKNQRTICILKSNQHPENGSCVVHIKDTGIE